MQTRPSISRRRHKKRDALPDQKWLTYFLAFILILLIVVFVVLANPKYKNMIVEYIQGVLHKEKKVPRPRPGLGAEMNGFGNKSIAEDRGAVLEHPYFFRYIISNPQNVILRLCEESLFFGKTPCEEDPSLCSG